MYLDKVLPTWYYLISFEVVLNVYKAKLTLHHLYISKMLFIICTYLLNLVFLINRALDQNTTRTLSQLKNGFLEKMKFYKICIWFQLILL